MSPLEKPAPSTIDRQLFIDHLVALKEAIGHVQPLAEYQGNFEALRGLVCLMDTAQQILVDIDGLLSEQTKP